MYDWVPVMNKSMFLTAEEAFEELKHQLKSFLVHVYVNHKQAVFMKATTSTAAGENHYSTG